MSFQNPSNVSPYNYDDRNTPSEQLLTFSPSDRISILNNPEVESIILMDEGSITQLYHPKAILAPDTTTVVAGWLGNDKDAANLVKIEKNAFSSSFLTYVEKTDRNENMILGTKPVPPALFTNGVPDDMDKDKIHVALLPIWNVKASGFVFDDFSENDMDREIEVFTNMHLKNWIRGASLIPDITSGRLPNPTQLVDVDMMVNTTNINSTLTYDLNMPIKRVKNRLDPHINPQVIKSFKLLKNPTPSSTTPNTPSTSTLNQSFLHTPAGVQTPTNLHTPNQTILQNYHNIMNPTLTTVPAKTKEETNLSITSWRLFSSYPDTSGNLILPQPTADHDSAATASGKLQKKIIRQMLSNSQKKTKAKRHTIESDVHLPICNDITCEKVLNCNFTGKDDIDGSGLSLLHFKHPDTSSQEYNNIQSEMKTQTEEEEVNQHKEKRQKKSTSTYTSGKEKTAADLKGLIANFLLIVNALMDLPKDANGKPLSTLPSMYWDFADLFADTDFTKWLEEGMNKYKYVWIPHMIIQQMNHILQQWKSAVVTWDNIQHLMPLTNTNSMPLRDTSDVDQAVAIANDYLVDLKKCINLRNYKGYETKPPTYIIPTPYTNPYNNNNRYSGRGRGNDYHNSGNPTQRTSKEKGYIIPQTDRLWCKLPYEARHMCLHALLVGKSCWKGPDCQYKHANLDDFTTEICKKLDRQWCDTNQCTFTPALQSKINRATSSTNRDTNRTQGRGNPAGRGGGGRGGPGRGNPPGRGRGRDRDNNNNTDSNTDSNNDTPPVDPPTEGEDTSST